MTDLTLAAIRFTDDLPAMQHYLEAMGLAPVVSWGPGMVVLASGAGQVWLHSAAGSTQGAPVGCTQLTGLVGDPDALRDQLAEAGFEATIVDEAYGRTVEVVDPLGEVVTFNDDGDRYGSRPVPGTPDPETGLALCRFTDPAGPYGAFAAALGLARLGEENPWYVPYSAGRGTLGLHTTDGAPELPGAELGGAVTLGLVTTRSLAEIQDRLRDAGLDAGHVVDDEVGSHLVTVDADGQRVLVHAV